MNVDELLRAGYSYSKPNANDNPGISARYQKLISKDDYPLFYLTIDEWDWNEFRDRMDPSHPRHTYSPIVQFRTNQGIHINVKMLVNFSTTIEYVEAFYFRMFEQMRFEPLGD